QYENGARPGENLSTQLSQDRMQFRMQGRMKQAPTATHLAAFARLEEIAQKEFPMLTSGSESAEAADGAANMVISGKTLLNARTMRLFSVGFVKSMTIALVMITLIIGVLFRSVALALVSLLPNVLPILIPLSFFGLFGVPLDGPAILVSSVALGVCVDDTIHFFTKFVRARRAGQSIEDALVYAMTQAGGALTITTIVLMIGFSTLLLSDFTPNFMMGTLATLMIALAWALDFIVTPALLSLLPGVGRPRGASA
ncbi:MAG: MMPL family transporter, partial [Planctomycetota bacterium]